MLNLILAITLLFAPVDLPEITDLHGDYEKGCVTLTWSPVEGADYYTVVRSAGYRYEIAVITGTEYLDCELTPSGRGWQYNVISHDNETNEDGYSNFIVVKRGNKK